MRQKALHIAGARLRRGPGGGGFYWFSSYHLIHGYGVEGVD